MKTNETNETIAARIQAINPRSAWDRGVKTYALELLENLAEDGLAPNRENLLNGARDWQQYSEGGGALICDADIAERLCSPSELRKTRGGERQPSSEETWLDCQARALSQAASMILKHA